ncbi:MAG: oligoribonuclease [Enterobacterales bacterium]
MKLNDKNLIWIDMEMTGLNPEKDYILEIATVVTDYKLSILSEGPSIVIHQSDYKLSMMNKWNINTHTKSGLINEIRCSKINEKKAMYKTINFLSKWVPYGISPICGNSIYNDRKFLFKYMRLLENYFNYRCIDVSSLKELVIRWKPEILNKFKKNNKHRSIYDIYDSIYELSIYRKYFINL